MSTARQLLRHWIGAGTAPAHALAPLWQCHRCDVRWRGDSQCWVCARRDKSAKRSTHGPKG